ncbi:hypothetical protein M5X00_05595 [Paenibacillus alvei]|uniref:Uncharacterized protein n=1 Tax=Paenibacillus alvei TaxID=44250 RepID=A0ABT4H3M9_PAEAL|nr:MULTISPECIES: hypothetical protein [Paenibacillus]EJW19409.1 hypothetical protein PAV_1c03830 [Paenibacillus alvei DSM 29]MCY7483787.1 hypothetical protein [Paenibacillus alvei]MCY9542802.1 hypothetical protein [Paenibacillus alvei]MCY9707370.1 hypothetical protein [Paenibacillus alvei]MCY9737578.1 hypothetical protein [Paenibacillus alvei]
MEENRGSEQGLTKLYLNQEQSRGPEEASAIKQAYTANRASSPDESEDTDDYGLAAGHMHAGMTEGTLETHQMMQRLYGLYD